MTARTDEEETPLHFAAAYGHVEFVKALLSFPQVFVDSPVHFFQLKFTFHKITRNETEKREIFMDIFF